jgi:hypothetical protein
LRFPNKVVRLPNLRARASALNEEERSKGKDPQSADQNQDSGDGNTELIQQRREAHIDLGVNSSVSALSIASRVVRVQRDNDVLPQDELRVDRVRFFVGGDLP